MNNPGEIRLYCALDESDDSLIVRPAATRVGHATIAVREDGRWNIAVLTPGDTAKLVAHLIKLVPSAAPALDHVAALRHAKLVLLNAGELAGAAVNGMVADRIEQENRTLTVQEALEEVLAELHGDAPFLARARRALEAERAKES